jgi:hypothetical protein
MTTFLTMVLWFVLLLLCWPLALLAMLLFPVIWLISLPFRLVFNLAEAFLAFIKVLFFLPARLLGHKS